MAKKRVKVQAELIQPIEEQPKLRPVVKQTTKKIETEIKPIEKKIDERKSTTDNRFERHKSFGDLVKRAEITEKVKQGLLKWMFYGIDNDNGYQYYLKIKK